MGDWIENAGFGNVSVVLVHAEVRNSVANADEIEPGIWWVARVLVHRDYRGHGVGKELVRRMVALCASEGAREVRVSPGGYDNDTERQRGFYAACGFKPEGGDDLMVWRSSC